MIFTDEDLKRLKTDVASLKAWRTNPGNANEKVFTIKEEYQAISDFENLLARLEASEAFTKDAYTTHTIHYELYKAWEKSCGR